MKKVHFKTSDDHDQPQCKIVPDTTKIKLTKDRSLVTCKGCNNAQWRRENPWPEAERLVESRYAK